MTFKINETQNFHFKVRKTASFHSKAKLLATALSESLQKKRRGVDSNLDHHFCLIVWSNQTWKELFTWSLKSQHISFSCNILSLQTKQSSEILFGWEQIYAAKYKLQMLFMAKTKYLEPILLPEDTFRFLRLKFW